VQCNLLKEKPMSVATRFGLFLLITFFSGSIVVMAAKDLRNNLKPPTDGEIDRTKRLVQALRGDELFNVEAKYTEPHPNLQPRKPGSYLPDYDMKKIKSFILGLVGGTEDGDAEASDTTSAD
jgi:hypothetical protein